jgi:hypothetical protein
MRLRIEPTNDQANRSQDCKQCIVTIEHPNDDLNIWTVADIVADLLLGFGFAESNVNDVINRR